MINLIAYLKTLKPEDWNKKATDKWTVKDVVAHLVGWERDDVEEIKRIWETKKRPWFMETSDYDEFNARWVDFYKGYTPNQLIAEWEVWQNKVTEEIDKIGYSNIKSRPDLFDWLLENGEGGSNVFTMNEGGSHYEHHYKQIKRAIEQK